MVAEQQGQSADCIGTTEVWCARPHSGPVRPGARWPCIRRGAEGLSLSAMDIGPALAPSMAVGFYEPRSATPLKLPSCQGGVKQPLSSGDQLESAGQGDAAIGFTEEPWSAVVVCLKVRICPGASYILVSKFRNISIDTPYQPCNTRANSP
jgi:hypothetical protein